MAWERRGSKLYYYQSERARVELEEARTLVSAGEELWEAADILAVAELVAAGYHRHKGQWRRRRA